MKFKKILLCKGKRKPLICFSGALLIVLLLIMIILFRRKFISFVFTIMLLVLGCLSSQFKRITGDLDTGVEFIPFASILFFQTHGFAFGLVSALFMMTVSSLLVGQLKLDLFISLGIFLIVGLVSVFLTFGIVVNGIVLVVVFNILSLVILTLFGFDFIKNIIYFFGSIFFNVILFRYFSTFIAAALTLA